MISYLRLLYHNSYKPLVVYQSKLFMNSFHVLVSKEYKKKLILNKNLILQIYLYLIEFDKSDAQRHKWENAGDHLPILPAKLNATSHLSNLKVTLFKRHLIW